MEQMLEMYWMLTDEARAKVLAIMPDEETRKEFEKMAGLYRVLNDKEYREMIMGVVAQMMEEI